jgi:hypothetical protein
MCKPEGGGGSMFLQNVGAHFTVMKILNMIQAWFMYHHIVLDSCPNKYVEILIL